MGKAFFKQTIRDVEVQRQTVLVRVDYNVPLTKTGEIADDLRIRASLPTLQYLLDHQCKLVLISHLGRPQGRDAALSLAPVAARLAELLGRRVLFVDDVVGDKVRQMVRHAPCGSVILLENLRFYAEEEADDDSFARSIAKSTGANFFVQDGFAVVHRAHASTHAITLQLPSFAGLLLEKEYQTLTGVMESPQRPLVAIIGGAKISDKIELIHRLIDKADTILIGGAMANTFLAYKGYAMGKSLLDAGQEAVLDQIYRAARDKVGADAVDDFLVLPTDVAVGHGVSAVQVRREVNVARVGAEDQALDIGTETIERMSAIIQQARTVLWNGPLGVSTIKSFSYGSARIALAIAQNQQALSVIGGGDTAEFVLKWDGHDGASFDHVSTGGGASLELLSGQSLPGVDSLLDAHGVRMIH